MVFRQTRWEGGGGGGGDGFKSKQLGIMWMHCSHGPSNDTFLRLPSELFLARWRTDKTTQDFNEDQFEPVINSGLKSVKTKCYRV